MSNIIKRKEADAGTHSSGVSLPLGAQSGGEETPPGDLSPQAAAEIVPDGICVGIILGFPERIARELQLWRASFGDPMASIVPAHITLVTTTPARDWETTLSHARKVAKTTQPFRLSIHGTGSFRPLSPVVYIRVVDGFEECVQLHSKLQSGPLARDLVFPYHPHVTVAHDVAEASLDDAENALENYHAEFPVTSMGVYEHDSNGIWQLREEMNFGTDNETSTEDS
ncbi:2'-5' RNA ligase family protein [Pseudarthrobacter sp. J1763]|uniref:2'-5' RNA ligase family protein n=1 Tax=Pseudarthrobacter sp. J1763 TaxID=3420445 RepID=UPI003D2B9291